MENIARVSQHIQNKLIAAGTDQIERRVLTLIPTRNGEAYYTSEDGQCWRAYRFVDKAHSHDTINTVQGAEITGRAFGEFQEQLIDLPAPPLHETIPNFHCGPRRLADLRAAVASDPCGRAASVAAELAFIEDRAETFEVFERLIEQGKLPLRITHNDTKINNVMIDDATGEGLCVIDLDTVMPGLVHYDFGDMIRTGINTAAEDECDLSRVGLDMELFEGFVRGYLGAVDGFITEDERELLAFSSIYITVLISARFLTDHLNGDHYFRIHHKGHNLDRTRCQIRLVELMEKALPEMKSMIESISREIALECHSSAYNGQ